MHPLDRYTPRSSSPSDDRGIAAIATVAAVLALVIGLFAAVVAGIATPDTGARTASADRQASRSKLASPPLIKSFSPGSVAVGETLTVKGRNFTRGKNKMLLLLQRRGGKRVVARGSASSSTKLAVLIPNSVLLEMLDPADTDPNTPSYIPQIFRMRLIGKRGMSRRWTKFEKSPTVLPAIGGAKPGSDDCDNDGVNDAVDTDDDNDLLPDTREAQVGTDLCRPDTDGDTVSDYYEVRVSDEFNGTPVLPFPGRKPYPNPLFNGDANTDHDGDGLTMFGEYNGWQYTKRMDRFYSDANQDSDGDGLYDDLEDEDNDLLSNRVELTIFDGVQYPLEWLATDTDGDGLCDGLDDQDRDGPVTPVSVADCTTAVPNNPGDPDPSRIDGDDNIYSNWYESYFGTITSALDPCDPSPFPVSPYCPHP